MITNNGSVALVLLAVALNVLSFLLWRNSRLQRLLRHRGNDVQKDDFSIISSTIEQERSRISAELHDELGTLLSVIYFDLELITQEASALSPGAEVRLAEVRRNLSMVIESIRTNIWNLGAQTFSQEDLGFLLRELCHKLDRIKGTSVTFLQSGSPFTLEEKYKLNLFRITQELLTNVIKHSSAWNILVHIDWDIENAVVITLEDDGVSLAERKPGEGMGMSIMARRALYIDAEITREKLEKGHRVTLAVKIH